MAPSNFYLFPKLKSHLRGTQYGSKEGVIETVNGDQDATECGFEILPHPPYTPDMAPSDFYLFPKLDSHLRGTQYGSKELDISGTGGVQTCFLELCKKTFYFVYFLTLLVKVFT